MRLLYNLLFTAGFLLLWPYMLWRVLRRGEVWRKAAERFGCYGARARRPAGGQGPLWIHAVSVGEMRMALGLLKELRRREPGLGAVLTTTTVTGRRVAEEAAGERTAVFYHPVDLWPCVRLAMAAVRPRMLVLMEQELWPNLLWEAARRGVPVWVVNARMSDRTARRMGRLRALAAPILRHLEWVGVQVEGDVERLRAAGFPAHKLFVTGSLKFETHGVGGEGGLSEQLRGELGWEGAKVLLGGSTHAGEERMLAEVFGELRKQYPDWRLLVVPRHFERGETIESELRGCGLRVARRTRHLREGGVEKDPEVYLADTTGELAGLYPLAEVAVIGKSFLAHGGQNFGEAARAGCAVVVGPHMENFRELLGDFLREGAVRQVTDAGCLGAVLTELCGDGELRKRLGAAARAVCERQAGARERVAEMIHRRLAAAR